MELLSWQTQASMRGAQAGAGPVDHKVSFWAPIVAQGILLQGGVKQAHCVTGPKAL